MPEDFRRATFDQVLDTDWEGARERVDQGVSSREFATGRGMIVINQMPVEADPICIPFNIRAVYLSIVVSKLKRRVKNTKRNYTRDISWHRTRKHSQLLGEPRHPAGLG
ncbi:hypothetical protein EDD85DRAFT_938646 [Armillaria nabsnona]|nr:hypothetical protein EDD85DRAFT_938646 [Armillaria nabsnona]